jgi:tRNA dimethylallyltransferase
MNMLPLIVIAGPTAVGKTDLAIRLAESLDSEIISADSMQVYKYMDIGTAKPTLEQQRMVKHHLIDIVDPSQDFSVADYQTLFNQAVDMLHHKGKIPLVVGGTGLYIRACLRSFSFSDPGPDQELRQKLREETTDSEGMNALYEQLKKVDPLTAERIHPNDHHRIIRALEVYLRTGIPFSKSQKDQPLNSKYQTIYLFLDRNRDELYHRIENRVDQMLDQGLIEEVEELLQKGYSPQLKAMQGLGYQQINQYLQNTISFDEARNLIKQKTRNYAKRQLTWFRKEPVDQWVNISGKNEEFFGEILNYIEGRLNKDVE